MKNSKVPDYLTYLNSDIVQNQKLNKEAEAMVKKQQQEYDKREKEFEENCLSGWDGSHRELIKW
ncbi:MULTISPECIES: hypothetical protein [unclassified Flavobacterium]|uniref:hypothetical protein n=1 Tax=unclassified Flavobacterium TaxID=196869 RepID=UPI001F13859E|nr:MULTISPECIES: hypothetical protein [unclassified Flavobacterium]UMY64899.1 hypothetical protein MKO97_10280 [Flavobacterium sp. HJ-32-4]